MDQPVESTVSPSPHLPSIIPLSVWTSYKYPPKDKDKDDNEDSHTNKKKWRPWKSVIVLLQKRRKYTVSL